MGLRRQDLQEAFFVPGSHAFQVYGYGAADPLEAVLRPGHFAAARAQLRPGELIAVSLARDSGRRKASADAEVGGAALVMVARNARGVPVTARLAQDFGGPDGGAPNQPGLSAASTAPPGSVAAPPPRRRGRPPGSRSRKPA